jgi:hypothetical protein
MVTVFLPLKEQEQKDLSKEKNETWSKTLKLIILT